MLNELSSVLFSEENKRRTVVILIVAALALAGLGSAIHNAGWSQGFLMGLLAGNVESGKLAPAMIYQGAYGMYPGHAWSFGGFIAGIFRIAFFLFVISLLFRFLGFWRWRMHAGWRKHGWPNPAWHHPAWSHGPWSGAPEQQAPDRSVAPGGAGNAHKDGPMQV